MKDLKVRVTYTVTFNDEALDAYRAYWKDGALWSRRALREHLIGTLESVGGGGVDEQIAEGRAILNAQENA